MAVTRTWGIGVPFGPTTWPVTFPFVAGGLGRFARDVVGLTSRPRRSGGALKKVLGEPSEPAGAAAGRASEAFGARTRTVPARARASEVAELARRCERSEPRRAAGRVMAGSSRVGCAQANRCLGVSARETQPAGDGAE